MTQTPASVQSMKRLAFAFAIAGALPSVGASACTERAIDYGIVESVREVRVEAAPNQDTADLFEHAVKPRTADELLIRFDDGRALLLRPEETRRFRRGERVRILSSTTGARIDHE
jgi:outer membrane lipoprotein SlyB